MNIIISIVLFIIIFFYLYIERTENFIGSSHFLQCKDAVSIKINNYTDVSKDDMDKFGSGSDLKVKKISYSCPNPEKYKKQKQVTAAKSPIGGGTIEMVSGTQYGYEPSDIKELGMGKLVKSFKGQEYVSNYDMIPFLVNLVKNTKMTSKVSFQKAQDISTKISDMEKQVREIEEWKKTLNNKE